MEFSIPLVLYPIDMIFPRMRSISKRSITVFTVIPLPHPIKHYSNEILCWGSVKLIWYTWKKLQTSCLVAALILWKLCNRAFQLETDGADQGVDGTRPDWTGPDRTEPDWKRMRGRGGGGGSWIGLGRDFVGSSATIAKIKTKLKTEWNGGGRANSVQFSDLYEE